MTKIKTLCVLVYILCGMCVYTVYNIHFHSEKPIYATYLVLKSNKLLKN